MGTRRFREISVARKRWARRELLGAEPDACGSGVLKKLLDVPMRHDAASPALFTGAHPIRNSGAVQPDDLRYGGRTSKGPDYGGGGFHPLYVAHIATDEKRFVAKSPTHGRGGKSYGTPMLHEWVKAALKYGKISQAELARRLTAQLSRQIDRAAVNKMTTNQRALAADEMLFIAELTGYPLPTDEAASIKKVPLVSWVSAGKMEPSSGIMPDDIEDWITFADLPPGDWIALTVDGDSMNRVAADGSTIFVNRSDIDPIDGQFYVFAIDDGDGATFKRYYEDPERLEPYSTNPDHRPIFVDMGVKVVGRVRMALSRVE